MALRVLIVDDHPLVAEALASAVRAACPDPAVDRCDSVAEAEAAARLTPYDMIILDLVLPDANGFSGLISLQRLAPRARIVVVSARQDPTAVATAYHLGAAAYLAKSTSMAEISRALGAVAAGGRVFPPGRSEESPSASDLRRRLAGLSGAQLRILLALADGRLNKQIAADAEISEATVKAHLTAIFRKLGVTNRTQAILLAQPLLSGGAT